MRTGVLEAAPGGAVVPQDEVFVQKVELVRFGLVQERERHRRVPHRLVVIRRRMQRRLHRGTLPCARCRPCRPCRRCRTDRPRRDFPRGLTMATSADRWRVPGTRSPAVRAKSFTVTIRDNREHRARAYEQN
jgi:hypothetical protein